MDGNRRFAREHNLPLLEGHRAGADKLKEVVAWCEEAGIKHLITYAFSTENWQRNKLEVEYLMILFREVMMRDLPELMAKGVKIKCVGNLSDFPADLQVSMKKLMGESEKNSGVNLHLALSYGGRAEILAATKKLIERGIKNPTEEDFSNALWTAVMPDPDLIIRTSGEQRLSGFLPWQAVYSELAFTPTLWPALTHDEFFAILEDYNGRERRKGR